MTFDTVVGYLYEYGYIIVFLALFCGIVGIPAPEESFLVLIGLLCIHHEFSLMNAMLSAILGTFVGMMVAYGIGYFSGDLIVRKVGRFVGVTEERWLHAQRKYKQSYKRSIIFGFYLPGVRQINPYFAGATKVPTVIYVFCSFIGSVLWAIPYILVGNILGQWFDIPLSYVSLFGFFLLFLFILSVVLKTRKSKQVK